MSRQGSQCSKHVPGTRSHGATRRLLAQEEGWNLILHQQDDLDFFARLQLLLRVLIERVRLVDLGTEDILVVVGHPYIHLQGTVSYTHLRAHETRHDLVCRL